MLSPKNRSGYRPLVRQPSSVATSFEDCHFKCSPRFRIDVRADKRGRHQHLLGQSLSIRVLQPTYHCDTMDHRLINVDEQSPRIPIGFASSSIGAVAAVATWAPPEPTHSLELDPTEIYEYEVLIFDQQRGRERVAAIEPVAAIELVSPANKDRPKTRQAFVSNCAALLQKKICVSIVDLVTIIKASSRTIL